METDTDQGVKMATTERTYIIPLRTEVNKSPKYKRAKKAVNSVKSFLERHMDAKEVKIGHMINMTLWKRGIKYPPGQLKVTATKDDKGVVKAELFGHQYVEKKKETKAEKSKLEKLKEKIIGEDKNKEAITHVPEHEHHDHTAHEHKELTAATEKNLKSRTGKEQAGHSDKS